MFCKSKSSFVSKLPFQLLLMAPVVQFYEGTDEQTANNI